MLVALKSVPHANIKVAGPMSGPAAAGLSREEVALLAGLSLELHPTDTQLLIRLIARVAELERDHGEEVALAMLENAIAYFARGRALN